MSRIRSHCCFPQRRLFNTPTSFYDVVPLPLEVDLLIDDLFDQLDFYERALCTRSQFQQPQGSFHRQQQQQRRPYQNWQQQPGQQLRGKSPKNVRSTSPSCRFTKQKPFQQKQQQFQGGKLQQQQKWTKTKMPQQQQQFGRRQQPLFNKQSLFSCGGKQGLNKSNSMQNVNKFTSKTMNQKYRICVDCKCCDCDPVKLRKSIKCGANGLYHLTVSAPCKTNPSKIFKRSYTLPSNVQHKSMTHSVTPQGHCCIEFPLMEQPACLAIADLMSPVQKIKTPEGKKAFFVQVPILPVMDPAKVKVCIKSGVLVVKFEHKKTIGDICSRVFYCCEVPLPKGNIDISAIVCKQNKHTLNITVPIKQGSGGNMPMTGLNRENIPIHRKLRQRKSSSMLQQQQQISGSMKQKQPIGGKQLKKPTSKSNFDDLLKTTTTPQKKQQQQQLQQGGKTTSGGIKAQTSSSKLIEGRKSPELLEEVFGFGSKSSKKEGAGTGGKLQTTKGSLDKGSQQKLVAGKFQTSSSGEGGSKSPPRNIASSSQKDKSSTDLSGEK